MDGWLVSWLPAGRNRVDQVVTLLPEFYSEEDVIVALRTLFFVSNLSLGEQLQHLPGGGVSPYVDSARDPSGYVRFHISFGSYTLIARRARNVSVTEENAGETIQWEEQDVTGKWLQKSFTRAETGHISFGIEPT
jgi:hypothetical protein